MFSECHELFGDPHHGREAADLAVQTMRRARKTAITLAFDTQSSRADAIPPKIVELVKLNACFAVKSWRSNDGFLGDGSFQAGIRATELRMGKDVGTSILTGATAERFEIVKWFYLEVDDDTGYDAAADIIARACSTFIRRSPDRPTPAQSNAGRRGICSTTSRPCSASTAGTRSRCRPRTSRRGCGPWRRTGRRIGRSAVWRSAVTSQTEHGIKVATTGRRYPVDPAAIRDAHRPSRRRSERRRPGRCGMTTSP